MNWMRRLIRKPQLEAQLDAELRFDFERTVAAYTAQGMNESEAQRRARLDFGGLEQVKEKCRDARGTRWLEDTLQDVRFACRQLLANPAFTTVAVLALALGIGANTAVFTVVNGVLLRPLPFPDRERLFLISHTPVDFPFHLSPSLNDADYLAFRERDKLFERVATFNTNQVNVTGGGDPVRAYAASVTPEFFAALGVPAAVGRTFLAAEDQPGRDRVAVIADSLWRRRFGADTRLPGKTITVDGVTYALIGTMAAGFSFPSGAELWTPQAIRIDPHNSRMRPVIGRLRPGVTSRQALAELQAVVAHSSDATSGKERSNFTTRIIPLKELLVGDVREILLIFAGAVAFVLLIACANVANLLLIRASARQPEIAVRAALGASRWRLVRQMLTESTLVSLCGGALGLLLAIWGAPALVKLAPEGTIPRVNEIHLDYWVLAFTFAVSLLNGLVFGLAPALRATRRPLRESMGGGHGFSARREPLRNALVVAEIALALVLLAGARLMIKSFARMRAADPGFQAGGVVAMTVELPDSIYRTAEQMQQFHTRLLTRLANLPGARTAAFINSLPLNEGLTMGDFHARGRKMPEDYLVDKLNVSPGYFRTMGIRLESGRDFTDGDSATAPGVVIVSQSVARTIWPGETAIGKVLTMEDQPKPSDWLTVIGVVDEVKQQGLATRPDAALYQSYRQVNRTGWLNHMTFVVRTPASAETVARSMRAALWAVDGQQPGDIATLSELIDSTTAEPLFQARLLGGFSLLALLLAAIGIYGVLAYSVTERAHEIGIRMALGADRAQVLGMVLSRAAALAAAGIALGTGGALELTRVLGKLLFDVQPNDPSTLAAVATLLAAVAVAAAIVPARRAAGLDPMIALRCE